MAKKERAHIHNENDFNEAQKAFLAEKQKAGLRFVGFMVVEAVFQMADAALEAYVNGDMIAATNGMQGALKSLLWRERHYFRNAPSARFEKDLAHLTRKGLDDDLVRRVENAIDKARLHARAEDFCLETASGLYQRVLEVMSAVETEHDGRLRKAKLREQKAAEKAQEEADKAAKADAEAKRKEEEAKAEESRRQNLLHQQAEVARRAQVAEEIRRQLRGEQPATSAA